METKRQDFPLLIEAAETLQVVGSWQRDITSKELEQLMLNIITSLTGTGSVRLNVNKLKVNIVGDLDPKANVVGTLQIIKPISAQVDVAFIFKNKCSAGGLVLESHFVKEKADNLTAKMALGFVNLPLKISTALSNVNEALTNVIKTGLSDLGVNVTKCICCISNNSMLNISLEGSNKK